MLQLRNRFISTLLCCCLIATVIPIFTFTSSANLDDDYVYEIADGEVIITAYKGTESSIVIPNTINNLPVTAIGCLAFYRSYGLTSVIVPNSVTSIDTSAFRACQDLKNIVLSSSLLSISDYTFEGCYHLTNIVIPESIVSIGQRAFGGCSSIKSIIFPNSLTTIENYAFAGCTSLSTVIIPENVTRIGTGAFNFNIYDYLPQYPIKSLSIIGYENTKAQSYAKGNGIPFIAIKDYPADALGDVNADDAIDAQDALLALQQSVKTVALGEASAAMADVDKNGAINARDALLMLQYSVHLINRFD